jgi:hypothetical protein
VATTIAPVADKAFSPLDKQLGLEAHSFSPQLVQQAAWLSSLLPFEQAGQVMERIGGYSLPTTSLWEQSQRVGETLLQQQQKQEVSVERTRWEAIDYQAQLRRSVSMDGGMVNIREEGWKEVKVGVIGTFEAPQDVQKEQSVRCSDLHYTAHIGGVEGFAKALWRLAVNGGSVSL